MTQLSAPSVGMLPGLNTLLSRYAESMMWLARYMERIENLARLIEVTEAFVRGTDGETGWDSIVQINSDESRFQALYPSASGEDVLQFYIIDPANPSSIRAMANAVRENARSVRPLISTEMWMQLNIFTRWILDLKPGDIRQTGLSALCNHIKQDCQTHTGITEGTLYRDQAWLFYLLGRHLERSDQITRLIDIRYHKLLPLDEIGSEIDTTQWVSVLRSAAAYHAFRRLQPVTTTPANVVGFLLKMRVSHVLWPSIYDKPPMFSRPFQHTIIYESMAMPFRNVSRNSAQRWKIRVPRKSSFGAYMSICIGYKHRSRQFKTN